MKDSLISFKTSIWKEGSHEYRFNVKLKDGEQVVYVERNFNCKGEWDGIPSGWNLNNLTTYNHSFCIDSGQEWFVNPPSFINHELHLNGARYYKNVSIHSMDDVTKNSFMKINVEVDARYWEACSLREIVGSCLGTESWINKEGLEIHKTTWGTL